MTKNKTTDESATLDLDALLQKHTLGLDALKKLPEKTRAAALRAYIRSELLCFEKEKGSFSWVWDDGEGKTLLEEREHRFLHALELASSHSLDTLLTEAAPAFDAYLRAKLTLWERMGRPYGKVPSLASVEERWLMPYFETLSTLRTLGYTLSDKEAAQSLLDDLDAAMIEEASGLRDSRGSYTSETVMYFDSRRIERAVDLIEGFEALGANGGKEGLLSCLYELFICPREHYTYSMDYNPLGTDGKVVLVSEEQAVSTMEKRFSLLKHLEKRGYAIDYQRIADSYTKGLRASTFFPEKKSPCMSPCGKAILSQMEWLDGKGADLTAVYSGLARETIATMNDGRASAKACIPLLEYLSGKGAFDADQLAFLKAISAPQYI